MKVRLTLNIGRPDAARLGIVDPSDGAIVEVEDNAGAEIIKRGWAVEYEGKPGKGKDEPRTTEPPKKIEAVPPTGMQAVPPVEIETAENEPEGDEPDDDEPSGSEPLPTTDDLTSPPKRGPGRPRKDSGR